MDYFNGNMNTVHNVISQHPQEDKKVFQLELTTNIRSSDKHCFVIDKAVEPDCE